MRIWLDIQRGRLAAFLFQARLRVLKFTFRRILRPAYDRAVRHIANLTDIGVISEQEFYNDWMGIVPVDFEDRYDGQDRTFR